MKVYLHVLIYLFIINVSCYCANILVILPTTVKSHLYIAKSIVNTLAHENQITFFTTHEIISNHNNITMKKISTIHDAKRHLDIFKKVSKLPPHEQMLVYWKKFSINYFGYQLNGTDLKELMTVNTKYDLLITLSTFSEAHYKFAHLFNVPLVQIVTALPFPWTNSYVGIQNNLAHDLSLFSTNISNSILQRIKKYLINAYMWFYYEWIYLPSFENSLKGYFPPNTSSIQEILYKTEGLLIYYVSSMGYTKALPPNAIETGGLHCKPSKLLPPEIEEFISQSGEHGIIYFSLGGTVSDLVLSDDIKTAFINVFKKLPYKILWKLDKEIDNLPENVKISKWFPQQDILGHKKIKLFITQGGMLSLQEAIYHGVPVLVLPLIYDQFTNGYLAEEKGYGLVLKFEDFNEDLFYKNIQELIYNSKYKSNARILSTAMQDQIGKRGDDLNKWISYIIRNKNTSPLRPKTANLSLLQVLEFDVIFILVSIFAVIIYLITKLINYILYKIYYPKLNKLKML